MAIDQQHRRLIFQNLDRQLLQLAKRPEAEYVHKFRTYSRRVETFLENFGLEQTGNNKKLLRLLGRLRRKAGRVRDLDVQTTALENLRVSSHSGHKAQLLREMQREREQRQKKLIKALDEESVAELRKRLKRAALEAQVPNEVEPFLLARQLFTELDKDHAPLTEKRLHQYRLLGKRVRYMAEFAGASAEAKQFIEKLKRMQDAIGDWHDWLELAERAEKLFGRAHDSSLVAVLQNLTRAKFRQAVRVLTETRQWVAQKAPASTGESFNVPLRKSPASSPAKSVSAVA